VFFIGQCADQSLSNCLILFVYAARKLINHLIAEKMPFYFHGYLISHGACMNRFFNNRGDKFVDVVSDFT
jgi:hypothetical protein